MTYLLRLAVAAMMLAVAPAVAQQRVYTAADYARAERLHEQKVRSLVDRNQPIYRWSEDGRTLHYQINDTAGPRAYQIDPATGTRREVAKVDAPAPLADALLAPDGRRALLVRDANLWLREPDGTERALTRDGVDGFAYGTMPDFFYLAVPRLSGELRMPPSFVSWSPGGTRLFGQRFDERKVRPYPYVAWTPADGDVRPRVYLPRQALLGDAEQPIRSFYLTDVASGTTRQAAGLPGWDIDATSIVWSKAGDRAWLLATSPTGNGGALVAFDPTTMTFTPIIEERRRGFFLFNPGSLYNAPNVRVLGDGREAIWFSPRDGWGNLYLYDLRTGRVKRQLTRGPGTVLDLVAVDEAKRRVFFTGGGRRPGADPYLRQLYAVSLDGGAVSAITDDDLDHEIAAPIAPLFRPHLRSAPGVSALSPDHRWFVDAASRLDRPPVVTVRSLDTGAVVAELDRADPARFLAAGGRPPERFQVKAADGTTDLWGAIYLPPDYVPTGRYPVIDGIYAGPQVIVAPRTWNEGTGARPQMFDRNSLAQLGFIVVTIDARGTPGRSAAFQDVGYGNFADPQLDDHVAAIRQLARRYPGMDLTRVGAYGHSLGGYTSARALLRHPDFYKVAVSSAGVHAWERFAPDYRAVFGDPDYGGGWRVRPDDKAIPSNYAPLDNTVLADRLRGKLLIATGDLDENAPNSQAMALVSALTQAGKPYDLMVLPNTTHRYGALNYFTLRLWNYFVEHLMGAKPPVDFSFAAATPAPPAPGAGVPIDPPSTAPSAAAVETVRRLAVPIGSADTPISPAEATAIRRTIGSARIIGFGEVGHGSREPLAYRNRLIRWLIETQGLTAVAIESGIANTHPVGDWVAGGAGDPVALLHENLSWNFGDLQANLDLVRWLRSWNAAHSERAVRFYGIDASTRIQLVDGKPELDGAAVLDPLLRYLAEAPGAQGVVAGLTALRPQLRSDRLRALDAVRRAKFDDVVARADAFLRAHRATLVGNSGEAAYGWAQRLVWDLRHLPGLLAGWTTDPREAAKIMASIDTRDATMAAHARWLLAREGPRGRLLVFAANGHVSAGPMVGSVMRSFPRQPKVMGTRLRDALGSDYRAILTASARGKGGDDRTIGSLDRAYVEAGQPNAFLPLRAVPRTGWWTATQTLSQGEGRIDEVTPAIAIDGLLTIPALSPAPTTR